MSWKNSVGRNFCCTFTLMKRKCSQTTVETFSPMAFIPSRVSMTFPFVTTAQYFMSAVAAGKTVLARVTARIGSW